MYQPNYRRIAQKIVHNTLQVKPNEQIVIDVRSDALPYAELIAFEVFKAGGITTFFLHSDDLRYQELIDTPLEQLVVPRQPKLAAIKCADYLITVGLFDAEPLRFAQVSQERLDAYQLRQQATARAICNNKNLNVLRTDYPTRYMAQAFETPWPNFFEMFWRAMDIDYQRLREQATKLTHLLEQCQQIHIQTPRGTDLYLQRGQRKILSDDGFLRRITHLPAGEVYFAPQEESINGRIVFDRAYYEGKKISLLELKVEEGLVTPIDALEGFSLFMAQWDRATGDKNRIGKLGIGLNAELRTPTGFRLLDDKILGTIHLALGSNEEMGGQNRTSFYWPMLLLQPTIRVDNLLVLDRGRFTIL